MHDLVFTNEVITALRNWLNSVPSGTKIRAVNASLSPISHVKAQTLTETFNVMTKGTEFEGIEINVKVMPLKIKCRACSHQFNISKPATTCPKCNNSDLDMLHSREFNIDSIST